MKAPSSQRAEKVVLIGSQGTGKTSLVMRFVKETFSPNLGSTVGAAFNSKVMTVSGSKIELDIWDTAGSEKYRSLAPMYYRDARAAIIVVDLTNRESLQDADEWLQKIRENGRSDCIYILAANKVDLHDRQQISLDEISEFAFSHQIPYYRNTSALTGEGVSELFEATAIELLKLPALASASTETEQLLSTPGPINSSSSGGCC